VFAPDTGSSQSAIDTRSAQRLGLARVPVDARQETVCSTITVSEVSSGRWSAGGVALAPQALGTVAIGPLSSVGLSGLLGSDAMRRFGSVVFDYAGGRLVLGAG
jgi:predicted aspartyl protease